MSNKTTTEWKTKHPTYDQEYGWRRRDALRIEVLTHYGPAGLLFCSWQDCRVHDPDMLVLDHVEDNGASERKELGGSAGRGWNLYRRLKARNFPAGYQTLCCNHNHKKELLRARSHRKLTFLSISRAL
jgi:hypothetical protein